MTDKIDDGGPAFPRPLVGSDQAGTVDFGAEGMSLRDYFASAALQGMLSDAESITRAVESANTVKTSGEKFIAQTAYEFADAMLAARKLMP